MFQILKNTLIRPPYLAARFPRNAHRRPSLRLSPALASRLAFNAGRRLDRIADTGLVDLRRRLTKIDRLIYALTIHRQVRNMLCKHCAETKTGVISATSRTCAPLEACISWYQITASRPITDTCVQSVYTKPSKTWPSKSCLTLPRRWGRPIRFDL